MSEVDDSNPLVIRCKLSPTIKAAAAIELAAESIDGFQSALATLRDELRRAAVEFRALPPVEFVEAEQPRRTASPSEDITDG